MHEGDIDVLLIEDNPRDARIIAEALKDVDGPQFLLHHCDRLDAGLDKHDCQPVDVILLDLFLPDSEGIETVEKTLVRMPETPVVVLTGLDDKTLAIEAVRKGAQDYLAKGNVNPEMLSRSIRYAIERHRMYDEMRSLSMFDLLTGLHNRRGFAVLGERELNRARRHKHDLQLVFFDLDGFKLINDRYGHRVGDWALKEFASVLNEVFRDSDLVARVGGDEFIVMSRDLEEAKVGELINRLEAVLIERNHRNDAALKLTVSHGSVRFKAEVLETVDELMADADRAMRLRKQQKHTLT